MKLSSQIKLLIGASVLTIASVPAFAQDTQSTADDGGLQDIIVTAQKKAESLQSVPISVTAVSAEQFERMQVPTLQGLNGSITNAQINNFSNTPNSAVVTIRGIGVIEPDPYAGNTVSIVVDGIPQFFSMGALVDMYDVERVEVLKGPQGTLFGANTTGGVVNIVNVQPGNELGGKAELTVGNWNRINVAGAIDLPISEVLTSRWVYSHFERKGFLTNVVDGRDLGHKNTDIYRGTIRFAPTDNFEATLSAEYDNSRNGSPELTISAAPAESGPSRQDPSQIINYAAESLYVDRNVYPNMYQLPCPSRFDRCTAPKKYYGALEGVPNQSDLDTYRVNLTMNLKETAIGDITSITGYKKFKVFEYTDQDSSPAFGDDTRRKTTGWQFSEELRTSVDFTDRWNAIIGGFYLKTHYDHVQDFRINFAGVGAGFFQQNLQDQDQWSGSLFAQTYYNLTDQLKLQAGIRYSHEKTEMKASTFSFIAADPAEYTFDCATTCSIALGGPDVSGKKSWSKVGWKVGLDYKPMDNVLLYGSWTRGFKSGGFAGRLGIPQDLGPYNPETVDTYEIGLKSDLFDRHLRFNLTGFYTDYKNMQLSQIYFLIDQANDTFIQGNTILNAAKSKIKGFEAEVTAIPVRGLTLTGAVGYLDAKFKDFPYIDPFSIGEAYPTGISYNYKGNRLQNAPKWTAVLGANYEFALGDNKVALSATYKYTSSKILTAIDNARRSYVQPTNLVDANIEYFVGENLSLSFWGRNLFDKRYIQSSYDNFGYGALVSYQNPREYGLTARVKY